MGNCEAPPLLDARGWPEHVRLVDDSLSQEPIILVVENDPRDVRDVRTMLGNRARLVCVPTLQEALHWIDIADIVLLDMVLPDGTGVELIQEMESIGLHTPVVAMSAYHEYKDRVKGRVMFWIDKPLVGSDFLMAVSKALECSKALNYFQEITKGKA